MGSVFSWRPIACGFGMTNERKHITQPADWWAAFRAEADNRGMTLSEWIGEAAKKQLPKDVRKSLSERPAAHRPKITVQPRHEGK